MHGLFPISSKATLFHTFLAKKIIPFLRKRFKNLNYKKITHIDKRVQSSEEHFRDVDKAELRKRMTALG